jgi:glycerol uptake facilitator-like aquaporin
MATVSAGGAFFIEVPLTMFLLLMIFALTEPDNPGIRKPVLARCSSG